MRSYSMALCVAALVACTSPRGASKLRPTLASAGSLALSGIADSLEALPRQFGFGEPAARPEPERSIVLSAWADAEARVARVTAHAPESVVREWLFGDVYHAGSRLDVGGAWALAEQHLKRSLALDSTFLPPRLALARLYVNSGLALAPDAERLLRGAVVRPDSPDETTVHEGIAVALWYQGRCRETVTEVALVLQRTPDNTLMRFLREGTKERCGAGGA